MSVGEKMRRKERRWILLWTGSETDNLKPLIISIIRAIISQQFSSITCHLATSRTTIHVPYYLLGPLCGLVSLKKRYKPIFKNSVDKLRVSAVHTTQNPVSDSADALILRRMFTGLLLDKGAVVVIATGQVHVIAVHPSTKWFIFERVAEWFSYFFLLLDWDSEKGGL